MSYVLGVDGGATKTVGLVAELTGRPVVRVQVGATNPYAVGWSAVQEQLERLLEMATAPIGGRERLQAAVLGVAGVGAPGARRRLGKLAQRLKFPPATWVTHDARIAFAAGTPANTGVVLIAGTGSACFGFLPDGGEVRAGGWGHLLGDEGSAFALGLAALRRAVQAADGRVPSGPLAQAVWEALPVSGPDQLSEWVQAASKAEVARLAELVFQAAQQHDPAAEGLLDQAADELAHLVAAVAARLPKETGLPVVLAGGLLRSRRDYRESVARRIAQRCPHLVPCPAEQEPVWGAVRLAWQLIQGKGP